MNREEFLKELEKKTINMVKKCGPIVDVIHNHNNAYFIVEKIINFIIDYFWKPNTEGKLIKKMR